MSASEIAASLKKLPPTVRRSAEASLAIADILNGLSLPEGGMALEATIRAIEVSTLQRDSTAPNFREVMIQALGGYVGIGEKSKVGYLA